MAIKWNRKKTIPIIIMIIIFVRGKNVQTARTWTVNSEQTSEPSTNLSIRCGKIKSQWNSTIRQWYFVWKTLRASLDKNRISSWVWQNTYIMLCGHLKLFHFASPKFGNGKMRIRSHDTRKHRALSDDEFLYWWFTSPWWCSSLLLRCKFNIL